MLPFLCGLPGSPSLSAGGWSASLRCHGRCACKRCARAFWSSRLMEDTPSSGSFPSLGGGFAENGRNAVDDGKGYPGGQLYRRSRKPRSVDCSGRNVAGLDAACANSRGDSQQRAIAMSRQLVQKNVHCRLLYLESIIPFVLSSSGPGR